MDPELTARGRTVLERFFAELSRSAAHAAPGVRRGAKTKRSRRISRPTPP
jgi:hypothetical protein